MNLNDIQIDGIKLISNPLFQDNRGYFSVSYNELECEKLCGIKFLQDNISCSKVNVIRGLHMQYNPPQTKLVTCVHGEIIDVVVDLRIQSPTFKKYFMINLKGESGDALLVPHGFAHGFCSIVDGSVVMYKVDNYYNKGGEIAINYLDKDIGIDWGIKDPILSERDASAPFLRDIMGSLTNNFGI